MKNTATKTAMIAMIIPAPPPCAAFSAFSSAAFLAASTSAGSSCEWAVRNTHAHVATSQRHNLAYLEGALDHAGHLLSGLIRVSDILQEQTASVEAWALCAAAACARCGARAQESGQCRSGSAGCRMREEEGGRTNAFEAHLELIIAIGACRRTRAH